MVIELMIRENANRKSSLSTNPDADRSSTRSRRAQRGTRFSASVPSPRFV